MSVTDKQELDNHLKTQSHRDCELWLEWTRSAAPVYAVAFGGGGREGGGSARRDRPRVLGAPHPPPAPPPWPGVTNARAHKRIRLDSEAPAAAPEIVPVAAIPSGHRASASAAPPHRRDCDWQPECPTSSDDGPGASAAGTSGPVVDRDGAYQVPSGADMGDVEEVGALASAPTVWTPAQALAVISATPMRLVRALTMHGGLPVADLRLVFQVIKDGAPF